jgi:hypothetical protein
LLRVELEAFGDPDSGGSRVDQPVDDHMLG